MTDAAYWLAICGTRCMAGFPSLVRDPWCRRLLSEVAGPSQINEADPDREYVPMNAGYDGKVWTFSDCSQLLGNSDVTTTIGDTDVP